jgi:hypothetical protein
MTLLQVDTPEVHFGVFEQLANYGALGLVVLALGYLAWFFIKRNLDEKDRLIRRLEDMNDEARKNKQ